MSNLPYVTSPGNIDRALNGIRTAAVPDRVSQDFVKTILKIPGGSGDQMTSFLKKIGFTNVDGTPNDTYRKFRNPSSSGFTIAKCIKEAYRPLYIRNEYMHELDDTDLLGLVVEETGQAHDSSPVKLIFSCIKHLKAFANFDSEEQADQSGRDKKTPTALPTRIEQEEPPPRAAQTNFGLNLGYTINLNLPASSDPAVFDAIFKSLKANLLTADDA